MPCGGRERCRSPPSTIAHVPQSHSRRCFHMNERSDTYERLLRFIEHEMRMSHVYQPVMIRALLMHEGRASVRDIAKALLAEDRSQIEYYEHITRNMVGRVLTTSRGITGKIGQTYTLR